MSNDNKELKTKELCEEIKNLTEEDLDNVTGGIDLSQIETKGLVQSIE